MAEQEQGGGPELVPVEFHTVSSAIPGLTVRQGDLGTDDGTFVVTAVAPERRSDELDTVLADFRMWAGFVDDPEPVADEDDADMQTLIDEVSQEEAHIGLELEAQVSRAASVLLVIFRTTIARGVVHWYKAVPHTSVTVLSGRVRFRRPNKPPIELTPADGRVTRPTPNGSSIRGIANKSEYVIENTGHPYNITRG